MKLNLNPEINGDSIVERTPVALIRKGFVALQKESLDPENIDDRARVLEQCTDWCNELSELDYADTNLFREITEFGRPFAAVADRENKKREQEQNVPKE